MIKKFISTYIYCGLFSTSIGVICCGLRGTVYTKKVLDRAISHPEEVIEVILKWPKMWYKVGKGLHQDEKEGSK